MVCNGSALAEINKIKALLTKVYFLYIVKLNWNLSFGAKSLLQRLSVTLLAHLQSADF